MTKSITVGRLAKASGLSRSTLLYYDRLGLLQPAQRSRGDYRLYSPDEVERLRKIRCYRDAGIPLKQIPALLADGLGSDADSAAVLEHHVAFLEEQIHMLRNQQRQAIALLRQLTSRSSARPSGEVDVRRPRARAHGQAKRLGSKENDMLNKDRWVEIMRAAGLSDQDMHNWHLQFERMEPEAHQEFLQSLGIPAGEVERIRHWSQA